MIPLVMVQKKFFKNVAMSGNSSLGIAVKRDSSGAASIQQVAVSVYSGTRYSDSEK